MEDLYTTLFRYFEKEMSEGKTEFRLVVGHIPETDGIEQIEMLIHPQGKDGTTIDLFLSRVKSVYTTLCKK